jgi:hypothetical protein
MKKLFRLYKSRYSPAKLLYPRRLRRPERRQGGYLLAKSMNREEPGHTHLGIYLGRSLHVKVHTYHASRALVLLSDITLILNIHGYILMGSKMSRPN